jgi:hypothetical protein
MTTHTAETSPQVYARIGGVLYLMIIVLGTLGELFTLDRLIVSGDAVSTANHIMASPSLWRIGIAGDLMMHVFDIPLMLVFYVLLKPVNKNLALLAVLFNLIQTAVLVTNTLNLLIPLFLLGNADYLKAFEPNQLYALTYLFVKLHDYGSDIGFIFFGFECLALGYLIFKSNYLPRILGVLMQIAGLSYLTNSFTLLLAPSFASMIVPAILVLAFLGETSLCLWLLVKGVNVRRWSERAATEIATI